MRENVADVALFSVLLLLLCAAGLAVYWTNLNDFFALDDYIWLQAASNSDLGAYLRHAFTFPEGSAVDAATPFWRPLVDVYFYAAWQAFGDDPVPYHLVNLALHIVVAASTGLVAYEMTRSRAASAAAAFVFVVSPSYDFAVTWISSVTEVLGAALFVLTIVLFLASKRRGDRRLYAAALALFALALLTKESAVIVPVVLGLVALTTGQIRTRESVSRLAGEILPVAALAAAYFAFLFFQEYRSSSDAGLYRFGWHALDNVWDYLKALTLPVSPDRGDWVETLRPVTAAAFLLVGALMALRRDLVGCALFVWVFLALLPYSFFPAGIEARYTYLASIPFSILVVYSAWLVVRDRRGTIWPIGKATAVVLLLAVLGLSAIETRHRQAWISHQAGAYEQLYTEVPGLCNNVPIGANIYVLEPHHFDLFGASTGMALNLVYDDVLVSLHPDGRLPELAAFNEHKCVVRYDSGQYVLSPDGGNVPP